MKNLKDVVPLGLAILILTLLLIASGCTPGLMKLNEELKLIASPNFVAEHLPRLLAIEKDAQKIVTILQMLAALSAPLEKLNDKLDVAYDSHWLYFTAAHTYLVDGDLDRFVQAAAKAEHSLQKMKDLINSLSPDESTNPDPNNQSL